MSPDIKDRGAAPADHMSTLEAARLLGLAVRSVQLMVDRGELQAWKTPGGHRRITRDSVLRWRDGERPQGLDSQATVATQPAALGAAAELSSSGASSKPVSSQADGPPRVLLIEDSVHFQNLVSLLVRQQFPDVALEIASDAIAGLAMAGRFQPDVLIVDILLPGIDGATLITSLRTHPQFNNLKLIVITSLDEEQRKPYTFALQGVPVIHKPALVAQLPGLLESSLHACPRLASLAQP